MLKNWPKNTVFVTAGMRKQGIYRQLADTYVKGGWIERMGNGAFKRAGDDVEWTGAVYALQSQLGLSVHPAGKTALQLQGNAHYLPVNLKQTKIVLFGYTNENLPAWFRRHKWEGNIRYVMTGLFDNERFLGCTTYSVGDYQIKISAAERAALEFCYDVPRLETFEELDHIMSGLNTLRPILVQGLLERCGSVKAKRLFLYLAEKHEHAWVKKLDTRKVDLGRGKRSVCKNGRYDRKYKIVVP